MQPQRERILPIYIEEEMKDSYLDYSMSVIVSRALPDVRDGLKPVHRRVLYGMQELGLGPNRPYKKSARVVGEVLGKYHPHGDAAVYDAMVRMVQDFSLRYPLLDGQGNFGSVDGDSAAAMRYTEVRLAPIATEMLKDMDKDTVDFVPNFDETLKEPTVLPSLLPNLLINGSSGIAVGMATNIPPHNLGEVVDGLVALIDNPQISVKGLMKYIKGPDFPTGALIYGDEELTQIYSTGRGRITIRAKAAVETVKGGRENIVITDIPYQVNKASLIEKIADLVRERKIDGITDIRDESDREGIRIVIELRRDVQAEVVLNQLYRQTPLQTALGVIMLALVDGQPRVLNLKQILQQFLKFRHQIVVRRTKYELDKAEKRAHILEGLKIALDHIDEIVDLIKRSRNPDTARRSLMRRFGLSEVQAQAILDMRLQRLTGLERRKIEDEYLQVIKLIARLKGILESKARQMAIIKEELLELKEKYGDPRRTEIIRDVREFSIEDMIAEEDMVITISHQGFIKRFPVSSYRRQLRGGRGFSGGVATEEDFIEHLFIASTHHHVLFFTDQGRCYWLRVHEIPQAGWSSKGRAIVNLIHIGREEKIAAFLNVRDFDDGYYLIMATKQGLVKKIGLSAFKNPRRGGINAININKGDRLIEVKLTDGTQDIILGTKEGKAIRFPESEVREMGRSAAGVRGISLSRGDEVVGMVAVKRDTTLLTVTEKGYGKRTRLREYRVTGRGGKGIITIKLTRRTGKMIAIKEVIDEDDLVMISAKGMVIRQQAKGIKIMGRNTQGVRLIKLESDDRITDIARIIKNEGEK